MSENDAKAKPPDRRSLGYLSLVTAPIQIVAATGSVCGTATGFFYKATDNTLYLVTNWHVVTQRDPTNPAFSKTGATPTKLRLKLHKRMSEGAISLAHKLECNVTINNAEGAAPEWFVHPKHGHRVDVVVVEIDNYNDLKDAAVFNTILDFKGFESTFVPSPMDDVFVIGYPWGLSGGDGVLPLYKRGSVASEPVIDHSTLPRLLIDCRTSDAMSGSPVICSTSGGWHPDGTFSDRSLLGTVQNFLGVYSGRLTETLDGPVHEKVTEIGVVWKKDVIEEIIRGQAKGLPVDEIIAQTRR